jgi:hypothetical protein
MVLGGCASPGKQAYSTALADAFAEAHLQNVRKLASDETVSGQAGADFGKLARRVEFVVFPKTTDIAEKVLRRGPARLAAPVTFAAQAQRHLECGRLLRENSAQWAHREFFAGLERSTEKCAILRVFQVAPAPSPANTRVGDVNEIRLYLDGGYRPYGIEHFIQTSNRDTRKEKVGLDPELSTSSGLSLFPIDLPSANPSRLAEFRRGPLDRRTERDTWYKNKIRALGVENHCEDAAWIKWVDDFGSVNQAAWCRGDAWPTYVENDRFEALLKR